MMPPYIGTALVAKACGYTTKGARGFLRRAGVLDRIGSRWLVSEAKLRDRLPDVYERVFSYVEDRDGPSRTDDVCKSK